MPTLDAGSRDNNILRSIFSFVSTEIVTGLSIPIYFRGQGRIGNQDDEWIEIDFIRGSQTRPVDHGPSSKLVAEVEVFLNLNYFKTVESGIDMANLYKFDSSIADIRQIFDINQTIPVYDYDTGGNPQDGGLRVWAKPEVREIPTPVDTGVRQMNISVPLRYNEVTLD